MGPVRDDQPIPDRGHRDRLRALGARAGRWLSTASYLKKWIVLGVVIGVVAGLGAVVFYEALVLCTRFFLGVLVGYRVPYAGRRGRLSRICNRRHVFGCCP